MVSKNEAKSTAAKPGKMVSSIYFHLVSNSRMKSQGFRWFFFRQKEARAKSQERKTSLIGALCFLMGFRYRKCRGINF